MDRIKNLLHRVPGYTGYRDKENRRDEDKRIREAIANEITAQVDQLNQYNADLSAARELSHLSRMESLIGQVRLLDQAIYFKADRDFWVEAANAEAAELFSGKWVKGTTSDSNFAGFTEFTDKDKFLEELLERDGDDGTLTRVKGRTVDGQKTVGLAEKGTEDPGTLYVAASDKPYPLLVVPEDSAEGPGRVLRVGRAGRRDGTRRGPGRRHRRAAAVAHALVAAWLAD